MDTAAGEHNNDAVPTKPPTLIVVHGNSGTGKSTIPRAVRDAYGGPGCVIIIEQDYLRRAILREHDGSDSKGIAPQFITHAAQFTLQHGYHTIAEGILATPRYKPALLQLLAWHSGDSFVYYLDAAFAETIRRHCIP